MQYVVLCGATYSLPLGINLLSSFLPICMFVQEDLFMHVSTENPAHMEVSSSSRGVYDRLESIL